MAMRDTLSCRIAGQPFVITRDGVLSKTRNLVPEELRDHGVKLHGKVFPVKQVVAVVTGLDRLDFQSMQARSVLKRLGFELWRAA
jgi:hypothetical protein